MSKAKKKRVKRMKAKQRKEEEAKKASEPHIPDDSLNPHDMLRGRLVDIGYNLKVVDAAMDEMWDLQMDYSDFDSVFNFLQGGGGVPKQSQLIVEVDVDQEEEEDKQEQGDVGTEIVLVSPSDISDASIGASASASASYSIQADESNANVTDMDTATSHHDVTETAPVQQQQQPDVRSKKNIRVKPLDLLAKLDIVANSENLNDGIIALTEWVNKAASPSEVRNIRYNWLMLMAYLLSLSCFAPAHAHVFVRLCVALFGMKRRFKNYALVPPPMHLELSFVAPFNPKTQTLLDNY